MNSKETQRPPYEMEAGGWWRGVERLESPNFNARPQGTAVDLLVIHNISLPPGQFGGGFIADLFANRLDCDAHPYFDRLRTLRVSSHFLIRRDGAVMQFVSTDQRAWHAGASSFCGRTECNDFSIGIELEGTDFEPFAPLQYLRLAKLTQALTDHYPIKEVTGHQHIAPARKTDPGPFFDWVHFQALCSENHTGQNPQTLASLRFPPAA